MIDQATTSWTSVSPTATAANPAHVFYRDGSNGVAFQLNNSCTINGTLVIDGDLNVRGSGITITPFTSNYPALIVTGKMAIGQKHGNSTTPTYSITINGTCFIGTQLKSTTISFPLTYAEYSRFTVNGGLLIGSTSSPVSSGYNVVTSVTYNSASPPAPIQLSKPKGVSILRWGLP